MLFTDILWFIQAILRAIAALVFLNQKNGSRRFVAYCVFSHIYSCFWEVTLGIVRLSWVDECPAGARNRRKATVKMRRNPIRYQTNQVCILCSVVLTLSVPEYLCSLDLDVTQRSKCWRYRDYRDRILDI